MKRTNGTIWKKKLLIEGFLNILIIPLTSCSVKLKCGYIYVFEFKMDNKATAEDALAQINSKDYAIPYTADHRKLVKIGVEFSQTEKGVKRWVIE